MSLETFPPMVLLAARFLLSGGILLLIARARGVHFPDRAQALRIAINGVMTLGVGNACLVIAETRIASGLAALFITTGPFYMVAVESLIPGGARLHAPTIAGMVVGFAGAALLVTRGGGNLESDLWGFAILQLGNLGWALGSIRQRRLPRLSDPVLNGAIQQFAVGLLYVIPAMIEQGPIHWSQRGVLALLYLTVFGSIVGYSAYQIALDRLPVAIVSLYAYVNPVVAVSLGWVFYREPFGLREAAAMITIFIGVWLVRRFASRS